MHVPFPSEEVQLLLGKVWIDHRKWYAMESRVPCCKERIFPRVWHRQNVVQMHVLPICVTNGFAFRRWRRLRWISVRPLVPDEVVILFTPHHTSKCLPLNVSEI